MSVDAGISFLCHIRITYEKVAKTKLMYVDILIIIRYKKNDYCKVRALVVTLTVYPSAMMISVLVTMGLMMIPTRRKVA